MFDEEISAINRADITPKENDKKSIQSPLVLQKNDSDEKLKRWREIKDQIYQLQTSYDSQTS